MADPEGSFSVDEHEERERKRKRKTALVIGGLVLLAGFILFFDVFFNHLSLGKGKRPEGTEKLGLKAIRIAPEKERTILTEIRQLIDQGKTDAAEERVLTLLSRSPSSEGHYLAGVPSI